jgi:hypothetical protein
MTKAKHRKTHNEFNYIQPSIKFTIDKELHEKINYLAIKIHRKNKRLVF